MAVIHQAPNQSRQELEAYVEEKLQNARQLHAKMAANRPKQIIISLIVLALCVAAILVLIFAPSVLDTVQDAVKGTLIRWGSALMDWMSQKDLYDLPFLKRILLGLLEFLWKILLLIFGAIVYFIGLISPLLVAVILYGIPVVIAIVAIRALFDRVGTFNPEAARQRIMKNLPPDQKILVAGLEGEDQALQLMGRLDGKCHVFTNLRIPYQDGTSETDMIAVTPGGVTIIEVKNHKNTVMGDMSDEKLTYRRVGKRGKVSDSTFYNPVKQVGTHVYRLAHYLRDRGADVHVRRCVLFVNESVTLKVTDRQGIAAECPVFISNSPAFFRYLVDSKQGGLDDKQVRNIADLLDQLI